MPPRSSVWVGSLPHNATESGLSDHFSSVAPVLSVKICRDYATGTVLGHGYVNFAATDFDASKTAVLSLNNTRMGPAVIRVQHVVRNVCARHNFHCTGNIFIGGLPASDKIDSASLAASFEHWGRVLSSKVVFNVRGRPTFGFVQFDSQSAADRAVREANGCLMEGVKIYVGPYLPRQHPRERKTVHKPATSIPSSYRQASDHTDKASILPSIRPYAGRLNPASGPGGAKFSTSPPTATLGRKPPSTPGSMSARTSPAPATPAPPLGSDLSTLSPLAGEFTPSSSPVYAPPPYAAAKKALHNKQPIQRALQPNANKPFLPGSAPSHHPPPYQSAPSHPARKQTAAASLRLLDMNTRLLESLLQAYWAHYGVAYPKAWPYGVESGTGSIGYWGNSY